MSFELSRNPFGKSLWKIHVEGLQRFKISDKENVHATDQKKEDFRKYLERNGIVDALTKVLVGLYEEPEKPESPIDYLKQFLGGPSDVDVEALKHENDDLKRKVEELQTRIDQLSSDVKEEVSAL